VPVSTQLPALFQSALVTRVIVQAIFTEVCRFAFTIIRGRPLAATHVHLFPLLHFLRLTDFRPLSTLAVGGGYWGLHLPHNHHFFDIFGGSNTAQTSSFFWCHFT
jgi:hypothetical protein